MADVMKTEVTADQGELTESDLEQIAGGKPTTTTTTSSGSGKTTTGDFHFTKTVDSSSPNLF